MKLHKPLILASQSPRRQEILTAAGLKFTVHPADSEYAPDGLAPYDRVCALARSKAEQIAPLYPNSLILGADTMVVLDDIALGKPRNEADAVAMLMSLQGRTHQVMTGVWLIETNSRGEAVKSEGFTDATSVDFYEFTRTEAEEYVATGEPMDKAGSYGIQGLGMRFVKGVRGDYFTVMGLPGGPLLRFVSDFVK